MRILVAGMIAGVPRQGGATWAVLQYLLGLIDLGHTVHFVEPVKSEQIIPEDSPLSHSGNAAYFLEVVREFGFSGSAAMLREESHETVGMAYEDLQAAAKAADLVFNLSGLLTDPTLLEAASRRVYVDLDPAFTQLWQEVEGIDMRLGQHTHFVTVGLLVDTPGNEIPTCGVPWLKTFQPVVLERWPFAGEILLNGFSTVANWRGYGSIAHRGILYGQKVHSFRELFALPSLVSERLFLALAIDPGDSKDIHALQQNNWILLDPEKEVPSPASFARFVQGSKGEIAVAKSGYVASNSGWFSDRSACYLASGRPVVAQETGFSSHLPTGEGLLAFETPEEASAAICSVSADYEKHRRAARMIAEEYFDSRLVLTRLIDLLGSSP